MKKVIINWSKIVIIFIFFLISLQSEDKIPANEKLIEEVKQGKHKVVYASWWGYDPEDSTQSIQSAIDSGVEKVIIDKKTKPWIVSKTIYFKSNQEVLFETGVVVEAKEGAFLDKGESLFAALGQKNLTIIGYGATLKMRKSDYTKPPYEKSEWRHILKIRGCENVKIFGLTLASSGGDGIYLGTWPWPPQSGEKLKPNSNIYIKDVVCIDNHRQGISVINAENLVIENVVLKDTKGTPPMYGIDFEPNRSDEVLSNIVMKNCIAENNAGGGYIISIKKLGPESRPISIRFENCKGIGQNFTIHYGGRKEGVKGTIELINCKIENSSIHILKPLEGAKVKLVNCEIIPKTRQPGIYLDSSKQTPSYGGVEIVDCVINLKDLERPPIMFKKSLPETSFNEISGKIKIICGGKEKIEDVLELYQKLQQNPNKYKIF